MTHVKMCNQFTAPNKAEKGAPMCVFSITPHKGPLLPRSYSLFSSLLLFCCLCICTSVLSVNTLLFLLLLLCIVFVVADLNGSISQKWRRLRNCCASLRGISTQSSPEASRDSLLNTPSPRILVSTPHATSSLRLPGAKKSSVQDVLRAKLSRIHVGLRKRRALSVQEFFHSPTHEQQPPPPQPQPTFYVPSPVSPDAGSTSLPLIDGESRRRARSRQRNSVNSVVSARDYGYDSEQGYDSLPYEPPPDYDLDDTATTRRWSVVGSILHKNNQDNSKAKNLIKLENVNIKIPKTKLNHKHFERARSHSPNKNKYQTKPVKSETDNKNFNSKVVTSKSHYELMSTKQRPEVSQNGECERMSSEHKQVRI